ncbi:MAG: hypothetical protein A2X94_15040 [Bdellovibrionales bacterium GWB1_55_8]|nr:MAG: hypothetical protein A2X94_15040 [Bdellovibrionales bacterium GWB1_55_8]
MSCRKQQSFSLVGMLMASFASISTAWGASTITAIDFTGTQDPNELAIQADGPITISKQTADQDRQVILEIENATLPDHLGRRIDTSSFDGNVTLISPYQVEGQQNTVRVVVQLRSPGAATLTEQGNSARLLVPRTAGAAAAEPVQNETAETAMMDEPPTSPGTPAAPAVPAASEAKTVEEQLDGFIASRDSQRFTGKPITLQVRDTDAADVFRLIADASGFNIILGDDVEGEVTLSLVDVPWDQALDVLLKTLHLGAERNNNILRVVTLKNLTEEKTAELAARRASQASAPRITRIFPISFANLKDLAGILTRFASSSSPASQGGGPGASGLTAADTTAIVEIDNRTNSIIVRDLAENLDRIQKLVGLLDTQTPQVLIEGKIVEATETFTKDIGGKLGLSAQHGLAGYGSNQIASTMNSGSLTSLDSLVSSELGKGSIGFSPTLAFVSGFRLNAVLSMGESESQLKVISSPKTVVLNKESAKIIQTTPVAVPKATTNAETGQVTFGTEVEEANLSLEVKPTITNDGSVLMDLNLSRDVPVELRGGQNGIGKRSIKTIVLVESGSTLVIGGIYTMTSQQNNSGFPFLRKIPILGVFFGSESDTSERTELFIFITPKILNKKEAGLVS